MTENIDNDNGEECPSFFDEDDFDEDHALPISHND